MAPSLIRLDEKHIFVDLLQMHVGGNVETRGAHIPPSIRRVHYTLEDVQLHLGLPVDGPVVIGSVHTANWRDVCEQLFGRVPETIFGAQIDMNWLRRIFRSLDEDSNKVQREQHAQAYIFIIIKGLLMPDKLRNLAHLSYVGLLNELRDMQLLLDQRLEAEHVKVLLVVYATVEIHKSDRAPKNPMQGGHDGANEAGPLSTPSVWDKYSYTLTPMVLQTPSGSLFYQDGPSLTPPMSRLKDTQWQLRTNQYQLWMKSKKIRGENHNLYRRLNQEGIWLVTFDHRDVAHILWKPITEHVIPMLDDLNPGIVRPNIQAQ
ncbi:hypothetical protein Goshw_009451 [Gossypium schwendimanii]|uniref:Aminotransferase-like plant mobile domain-containing protein n=1 Tax=Gossypium schwendimanii TaxID=34291 RepID=A0A7J9L8T8_GOSSC|nr:hypothetical protein [Gossypium schwendimanii]